MSSRYAFGLMVAALAFAACDGEDSARSGGDLVVPASDFGAREDDGAASGGDGAPDDDAARATDAAPDEDGAVAPDAGRPGDGAVEPDAAPDDDAAPAEDATPGDAMIGDAVPADAAPVEPDAAAPEDAAPVEPDAAAVEPDAAAPVEPDAGPPPPREDGDGDGVTAAEGDCDDDDPAVFPGAPEVCNGDDDDCDGTADGMVEQCYEGPAPTLGVGVCHGGTRVCLAGAYGVCREQVRPGREVCGDGIDDDCDGVADDGCDADGDGFTVDGGDCDDADRSVNPDGFEMCNGVDDDCDGGVDDAQPACYLGPAGTEGVGRCRAGVEACADGVPGGCDGQVLPAEEACGNASDDDCDGQTDEGCAAVQPCPRIDLGSPLELTSACVGAGSRARVAVLVRLRDTGGAPMPGREVQIITEPAGSLEEPAVRTEGDGTYYGILRAPETPGEVRVRATVKCGAVRLALRSEAVLRVAPGLPAGPGLRTGGCGLEGHLDAVAVDAATGATLGDAWLLAGDAPRNDLQSAVLGFVRGQPGGNPNFVQAGASGHARLSSYGGGLDAPTTVTVGAEGYENVTIAGLDASMIRVPLRPVAPPPPATATVRGEMTQFDDLRPDGQLDFGLVLGSFDLGYLSTLRLDRVFSRAECWDPVTRGPLGGLVPPTTLPGNLGVPGQIESVFGMQTPIEPHAFALAPFPVGRDHVVALAGKVPTNTVVNMLAGGGDISAIAAMMRMGEIGVRRDLDVERDRDGVSVPLDVALAETATCRAANAPAGAEVLCVAAGDWSGGDGTGRLFPMGFGTLTAQQLADGPAERRLSVVPRVGEFRGVGYLGAAVARYPEGAAPQGRAGATSAVLDRRGLGAQGGRLAADGFLGTTALARRDRTFSWQPVGTRSAPPVSLCRVEVVRTIREAYDPGACSPARAGTREEAVWTAWTVGDPGQVALPALPGAWPRAAQGGFVPPASTREDDELRVRLSCMALGLRPAFDPNRADFGDVARGLTHISANEAAY